MVIDFGVNREPVYDFLVVINSNLGPISHRFWDIVPYWLKIANFPHPLSFSALGRGDPLQIYGKALRILSLPGSQWWRFGDLACTVFDWSKHVTDRRTELRWLRRAKAV